MNSIQTDDLHAETAVLGAVMLKPESLDDIPFLEARDFSSGRHELIYKVMRYLYENDRPVDVVTITEQFNRNNRMQDLGGVSYLTQLASSVPTASNIRHYADIVRSKAHRRRGLKLAEKIAEASQGEYDNDEDYFAAIDELTDEIRPSKETGMVGFADSRDDYFRHLRSKAEKLLTTFKLLNEWAGGLWRGWLFVLAGRPGAGKTTKALQYAYGVAKYNPEAGPVLIWSQEMDRSELMDRIVSMVSQVNYRRLINKGGEEGFTDNEWSRINKAYDEVSRMPIFIQDSAGVTIQEVRATARRFKKRYGKIALIVVDYLQIMNIPQRKNENRAQAIGRVTVAAKQTARQLKCVFMLLSQMSRDSESRDEPKLSDLKESGSIEQDADVVEFLSDTESMEGGAKVIRSTFAKGRNVGTKKFRIAFEWWIQRFVELEQKEAPAGERKTNRK